MSALHDAFVINLVSSTTPVALTRPDHAGLRRFTFFVSRRREEGRERFRLHMGYFETQEEAEKLLDIVREIYPGAWAGLAPGRGLRGTAALAGALESRPVPAAQLAEQPAPRALLPPAAVATQRERSASSPAVRPALPLPAPAAAGAAVERNGAAAARAAASPRPHTDRQATASSLSSVRAAIAGLGDGAGAKAAPARPELRTAPLIPPVESIPTCPPATLPPGPASRSRAGAASAPAPAPVPRPSRAAQELNDRAVLALLESRAKAPATAAREPAPSPQKPSYAVQLMWSVQPINTARVPPLAIFSAYTLYGAQGHRDGRRWYGLRLGFFTDAVSAKQVAQYVRADFATVSVVPVSEREREQARRATGGATVTAGAGAPATASSALSAGPVGAATVSLDEFKFIDDGAEGQSRASEAAQGDPAPVRRAPVRAARTAPGKRVVVRAAGRIHARRKVKQMTLEETLEILGANDLEVEPQARASGSEEAVPPGQQQKGKHSKLSRLFDRLAERLGS